MFSLALGSGKISNIRGLEPGQFFFLRAGGVHRLAVALTEAGGHSIWMNLTGSKAFELEASDQFGGSPPRVFQLPHSPDQILLRIDPNTASDKFGDHNVGQLLVSEANGVCIAVGWPGLEDKDYRVAVTPGLWDQDRVSAPRYAFDGWALSVVDQSGQWVDLIRRDPPSKERSA